MLSCKRNLATDQVLLVGVTAGSPLCLEEMQLRCCQEEGRLQLVLAGAALLGHCFPCPLSSVSLCAVVFLGVHSPWSHHGREEVSLKTRSYNHAALEASGSGSCDALLGGTV